MLARTVRRHPKGATASLVALATRPVSSVAARPSVLQLQQARQAQPLLTRLRQQTTRAYATNNNNVRSEGCSSRSHGGGDRAASSNLRAPGVWTLLLSASGVILGVVLLVDSTDPLACAAAAAPAAKPSSPKLATAPAPVPTGEPALPPKGGWPLFSADDIAAHNTPTNRIWVSFKDGVYDITDFVALHPGGASKIMLGAGSAIDPFWTLYPQHDHQFVRDLLAQYRIGTLKDYKAPAQVPVTDPYANEPKRLAALRVSNAKPFNAEPPLDVLASSYITPNELFFVRNHMPVPVLDAKEFKLRVGGEGIAERSYTLEELRASYPHHSLTATLQCAGNRRSEMTTVKSVKGLGWGQAAISTAQFRGVRLRDVLRAQGLDTEHVEGAGVKHVHFKGLDSDAAGTRYEASIPIEKVLDGTSDVLLAWEMNGVPLPPDHGFPLRAVVPGVVGARNVKWLGEVVTSPRESTGHWQVNDYKGFSPNVDWHNVDYSSAPAIQELPVTSAICEPSAGTVVSPATKTIPVRGYAWSGGGHAIVRVDVSADNGQSWHTATLTPRPPEVEPQSLTRAWAWTPWTIDLPLQPTGDEDATTPSKAAAGDKPLTLVCKAVDSSYNSQPETWAPIWNLRGCLSNAWHRVPLKVDAKETSN